MSLKQWIVLSVLACALLRPGLTSAANLNVAGKIEPAGACSIVLGNAGVIDLGNLSRASFSHPSVGWVSVFRTMPLAINCQHPTKVGVNVIDNREGTEPETWKGKGEIFGLSNPALAYTVIGVFNKADGMKIDSLSRREGETAWESGLKHMSSGYTFSWGAAGQNGQGQSAEPTAIKALTSTLEFNFLFIHRIQLTNELEIDGSMTLELVYL